MAPHGEVTPALSRALPGAPHTPHTAAKVWWIHQVSIPAPEGVLQMQAEVSGWGQHSLHPSASSGCKPTTLPNELCTHIPRLRRTASPEFQQCRVQQKVRPGLVDSCSKTGSETLFLGGKAAFERKELHLRLGNAWGVAQPQIWGAVRGACASRRRVCGRVRVVCRR